MFLWVVIVAGVIGLLILMVWVVGLNSPGEYTAHIELFMKSSPQAIWAVMHDIERHPVGAGMARNVRRLPDEDEKPAWEEDLGTSRIIVREVESVPNSRLTRICQDHTAPLTTEIEIVLAPVQGGTKINAVNRSNVRGGSWQAPMIRLVLRCTDALERGLKDYFRQIGKTLDAEPRFHARPGQSSTSSKM